MKKMIYAVKNSETDVSSRFSHNLTLPMHSGHLVLTRAGVLWKLDERVLPCAEVLILVRRHLLGFLGFLLITALTRRTTVTDKAYSIDIYKKKWLQAASAFCTFELSFSGPEKWKKKNVKRWSFHADTKVMQRELTQCAGMRKNQRNILSHRTTLLKQFRLRASYPTLASISLTALWFNFDEGGQRSEGRRDFTSEGFKRASRGL